MSLFSKTPTDIVPFVTSLAVHPITGATIVTVENGIRTGNLWTPVGKPTTVRVAGGESAPMRQTLGTVITNLGLDLDTNTVEELIVGLIAVAHEAQQAAAAKAQEEAVVIPTPPEGVLDGNVTP